MTKASGKGRGGKRPNAGRPARTKTPEPPASEGDLVGLAEQTLRTVMADPKASAAARVSASKVAIAISAAAGAGKPGKKGAQAEAAAKHSAAGRFAVPAGPRLVVDNK